MYFNRLNRKRGRQKEWEKKKERKRKRKKERKKEKRERGKQSVSLDNNNNNMIYSSNFLSNMILLWWKMENINDIDQSGRNFDIRSECTLDM